MERVTKAVSERRFVYVPFGRVIGAAAIETVTAELLAGDVELLDQEAIAGRTARVLVAAGTAGTVSVVRVAAETGVAGEVVSYEFEVAVSE